MRVRPRFTALGANRVAHGLDWGAAGLIAYAGHCVVVIYDPQAAEVVGTLTGHSAQVNCVKWLPAAVNPHGSCLLLSGAADATIRLWAWHGREQAPPWTCVAQLQGHASAITSLAVQPLGAGSVLLASTSADPELRLWRCDHGAASAAAGPPPGAEHLARQQDLQARFGTAAWRPQPGVHVGSRIQHCVALAQLPHNPGCVVMAAGGTDSTIRLYVWDGSGSGSGSGSSSGSGIAGGSGSEGSQQLPNGLANSLPHGAAPRQPAAFVLQCQLTGHENWVRGVAFALAAEPAAAGGDQAQPRLSLLLASAGQDRYGRIWCISTDEPPNDSSSCCSRSGGGSSGLAGSGKDSPALKQLITRYAPRPHLSAGRKTYWVSLEALLVGHEDWLHSVTWRPAPVSSGGGGGSAGGPAASPVAAAVPRDALMLLTASQDRSMMLWAHDAGSGLWMSEAVIGDAGASCLGFYGAAFSPTGDALVAHGFTAALHLWRQQAHEAGAAAGSGRRGLWLPAHALGGHWGPVLDVAWGGDCGCLQSVSADQTARLFTGVHGHWFELARTQVHGHDFSCLAPIPSASASASTDGASASAAQQPPACLHYVSGSDEKVLRVFEAPQAFLESLAAVRSSQSHAAAAASAVALAAAAGSGAGAGAAAASGRGRALGAAAAALGLSNKAVFAGDGAAADEAAHDAAGGPPPPAHGAEAYSDGPDLAPCAAPGVVTGPPLEEHLAQNTLWPELHKLYGHGNDLFAVAASPSGRVLASACRAQSASAAAVWVWEVGTWRALAQLPCHTLTVTQLEFAPDGGHLLCGSRDRSFSVWRVPAAYCGGAGAAAATSSCAPAAAPTAGGAAPAPQPGPGGAGFELVARVKAAHARIIWGVSWSHDGRLFATGSRDQTVKLWRLADVAAQQQPAPAASLPQLPAGVTAVALAPAHAAAAPCAGLRGADAQLLAVGLEDGQLQVWRVEQQQPQQPAAATQLWASAPWQQHAAAVRRLRWAPRCAQSLLCGQQPGEQEVEPGQQLLLASGGEDHAVRLFVLG